MSASLLTLRRGRPGVELCLKELEGRITRVEFRWGGVESTGSLAIVLIAQQREASQSHSFRLCTNRDSVGSLCPEPTSACKRDGSPVLDGETFIHLSSSANPDFVRATTLVIRGTLGRSPECWPWPPPPQAGPIYRTLYKALVFFPLQEKTDDILQAPKTPHSSRHHGAAGKSG